MAGENDDILAGILGDANPGDTGQDDLGGNQPEDNLDEDLAGEEGSEGDTDDADDHGNEPGDDPQDEGDELDADADDLAKAAAKARKGKDTGPVTKQKPGQQQQKTNPFDPRTKIERDKAGNLYVANKLVARAGREARNFLTWRKHAIDERNAAIAAQQQMVKIGEGARVLLARYDELRSQKSMLDNLGLTPQEQSQLLNVAAAYKKDPLTGIKMMLTQAHMAGVDIKSLAGAGSIDLKSITDAIKSELTGVLKPVIDDTSRRANQESVRNEANGFFARNPRAREVAKIVGGSQQLGQILKQAKERAPDVHIDELFRQLDYAILTKFGGRLPVTGPVTKKPSKQQRPTRSNPTSQRRSTASTSFDDIAKSVLADIADAETRGF